VDEIISTKCKGGEECSAMAAEILSEGACRPLIKERDPEVRERAIVQIVKKAAEAPPYRYLSVQSKDTATLYTPQNDYPSGIIRQLPPPYRYLSVQSKDTATL